jgi:hypothetical protein
MASTWDKMMKTIDRTGDNVRHAVHKEWAQSEMDKHKGQSGWFGIPYNELLDAAALVMDHDVNNVPDAYAERYRLIEEAKSKHQNPLDQTDIQLLLEQGKMGGR